jgi:predicted nuclease of predicted toxin-antitoxin system
MVSFKVDENLPAEATTLLKEKGYDALSVHDQNMVGSTDDKIADICQSEERAIVTLDLDFADIRAYPPEDYEGLIVLRLARQDKINVLAIFERVIEKLEQEELQGKLWIVNERNIRIRG